MQKIYIDKLIDWHQNYQDSLLQFNQVIFNYVKNKSFIFGKIKNTILDTNVILNENGTITSKGSLNESNWIVENATIVFKNNNNKTVIILNFVVNLDFWIACTSQELLELAYLKIIIPETLQTKIPPFDIIGIDSKENYETGIINNEGQVFASTGRYRFSNGIILDRTSNDECFYEFKDNNLVFKNIVNEPILTIDDYEIRNDMVMFKNHYPDIMNRYNFLIKHIPLNQSNKTVQIVIASNINFYQTTIPPLIKAFTQQHHISKSFIRVIVNNSPTTENKEIDGVLHCFITCNSWEYSAFVSLANDNNLNHDYYLLFHDTMFPGLFFKHFLDDINVSLNWEMITLSFKIKSGKSFNLFNFAFYSKEYIETNRKFLIDKFDRTINKDEGIQIEFNNTLLQQAKLVYNTKYPYTFEVSHRFNLINPQEPSTSRRLIYIPSLDVYKSQVDAVNLETEEVFLKL